MGQDLFIVFSAIQSSWSASLEIIPAKEKPVTKAGLHSSSQAEIFA
jgi:hypothetical protein